GMELDVVELAAAKEEGRAHAAFYDAAYFAAKKGAPTRKYRRMVTREEAPEVTAAGRYRGVVAGPAPPHEHGAAPVDRAGGAGRGALLRRALAHHDRGHGLVVPDRGRRRRRLRRDARRGVDRRLLRDAGGVPGAPPGRADPRPGGGVAGDGDAHPAAAAARRV